METRGTGWHGELERFTPDETLRVVRGGKIGVAVDPRGPIAPGVEGLTLRVDDLLALLPGSPVRLTLSAKTRAAVEAATAQVAKQVTTEKAIAKHDADLLAVKVKADKLPQAAVATPVNGTVAVSALDAGIVPTLVNIIGGGGVEVETRTKLNELVAAYTDLASKYVALHTCVSSMLTRMRDGGLISP